MDHEPGADTPGQDPESSESPEAPPRVPPYIAPPAAWGEPAPTPEPAPFADTPIPASELRDPGTDRGDLRDRCGGRDRLASARRAGDARAGRQRTAAALVGVEHRGPPTGCRRCRGRVGRRRHRRCICAEAQRWHAIRARRRHRRRDDRRARRRWTRSSPSTTTRSHAKSRASSASSDSTARPANSIAVEPGDIRSILEHARPAVVRIDVEANGAAATGTGFIVDAERRHRHQRARRRRLQDEVIVHLADGECPHRRRPRRGRRGSTSQS